MIDWTSVLIAIGATAALLLLVAVIVVKRRMRP